MQVDVKQYLQYRLDLLNRSERYARGAKRLYDNAVDKITSYLSTLDLEGSETFKLDGERFKVIDDIMSQAETNIEQLIGNAVLNEFNKAGINTKSLMEFMLGSDYTGRIKKTIDGRIRSVTASNAIKFDMPKPSLKVWNGTTLAHLEAAIQEGIANGKSASGLATYIKRFLNEPDNYYRRFRIKTGQDEEGNSIYGRKYKVRYTTEDGKYKWRDATEAEMKKESGLYASSYKNAMRYARTTTNIAYRTADFNLYQTLPMVIGIEIKTSESNHHVSDICDSLKGKYPKTFKWTGWHPNCRCYEIPLLAGKKDLYKMLDAIMNDSPVDTIACKNEVIELPKNFEIWTEKNRSRIKESAKKGTLPYFLKDNATESKEYREFLSLYARNDNYINKSFNFQLGCYKATHINHQESLSRWRNLPHFFTDEQNTFRRGNKGWSGVDLELCCQNALFRAGYSCVLEAEGVTKKNGIQTRALDLMVNGKRIDIASITHSGKYNASSGILNKSRQIGVYNKENGTSLSDLILYYHDPSFFNENSVKIGLISDRNKNIKRAICVLDYDNPKIIIIEKPLKINRGEKI